MNFHFERKHATLSENKPAKMNWPDFPGCLSCHLLYIVPFFCQTLRSCLLICVWYKNKGHFDQHATKPEKELC